MTRLRPVAQIQANLGIQRFVMALSMSDIASTEMVNLKVVSSETLFTVKNEL
jgi:hypothetical protein